MRLTARVPATSANLGPGFDCLGLALDLCNEVTVDTELEPGVRWDGEGADELPTDGSDRVSIAMRHAAGLMGRTLPPLALSSLNRIPVQRGLGSSAAAAVAGVALARELGGDGRDPRTTLLMSTSLEGHPDNVAAAIYGGLTIAYGDDRAVHLDPSPGLRPVVLVPVDSRLPTAAAREALPPAVALQDAAFNAAHAALAILAFTQRTDLLRDALQDRLHQAVRMDLVPPVKRVFEAVRDAGFPVCVSGAGPTLLVFEQDELSLPHPGEGWRVLRLSVRSSGMEIEQS